MYLIRTDSNMFLFQFSSVAQSCVTLCDPIDHSTPGFSAITNSQSLLKLTSFESVIPSNHLILCHPLLLLPCLQSSPASGSFLMSRLFASGDQSIGNFSFGISPFNEYSGLISFRIDWFDLLAIQETLRSLLQHHNSKALILRCLAFFIVQLSHPYMTTGKTIALTRKTFVDKVNTAIATATAKSLQSCLTLCDPIDGSPPDSPIPGILQARTLEWVAISFSNA